MTSIAFVSLSMILISVSMVICKQYYRYDTCMLHLESVIVMRAICLIAHSMFVCSSILLLLMQN